MGLFVKICGLTHPDDVDAVAALQPDAVGFVFWPRSRRCVDVPQAAALAARVPASILKVGVFVDRTVAEVNEAVARVGLDVAQLHGEETAETIARVKSRVWKAVHLDREPVATAGAYRVDAFLADSYSAEAPGGTGRTADWARVRAFVEAQETPVILAGGLTPENVGDAVRAAQPWGVDVSSGVEARPGRKDPERVRRFIEQCRNL